MKHDTVFVAIKGVGLIGGAMTGAAMASLSQWINSDVNPGILDWTLMGLGVASAGFSSTVAFCSSSVSNWRDARTNGNGNSVAAPPTPTDVKPGP